MIQRRLVFLVLILLFLSLALPSDSQAASAHAPRAADQGFLVQVSNDNNALFGNAEISGDGRWVVYTPYGGLAGSLYLAPTDGSAAPQIIGSVSSTANRHDISAKGDVVWVDSSLRLKLYHNGATQDITPCVQHPDLDERCLTTNTVAFSGNGQWVFIVSGDAWPCHAENMGTPQNPYWQWVCEQSGSGYSVWRVSTITGGQNRIAGPLNGALSRLAADFSGSQAAFACLACDGADSLYAARGDGGGAAPIATLHTAPYVYDPVRISGDGNWILFGGNAGGQWGLDIIRPDGSGHRQLIRNEHWVDGIPRDYDINYDGSIIALSGTNVDWSPVPFCTGWVDASYLIDNDGGNLRCAIPGVPGMGGALKSPRLSKDGLSVVVVSDADLTGSGVELNKYQVFAYLHPVGKTVAPLQTEVGNRLTYAVAFRHGEDTPLAASLADPIPANAVFVPGSLSATQGTAVYDPGLGVITWAGAVAAGQTVTVTFQVTTTCAAPPPPNTIANRALATLGSETYRPLALAAVTLPPKELATLADAPAEGARCVLIESGGQGPLIQWHDLAPGMACGSSAAADVAYRLYVRQQGGAWVEKGAYPNCARQVQLAPTDLACQSNGDPAAYEWRVVAADPKFPCRNPLESVFHFETASCRPTVELQPQYTLDGTFFLENVSLANPVKALVDWNGPAYATADTTPPYGDLYFELNDVLTQVPGEAWGGQTTYDMGDDFSSGLACGNNTLRVWAVYPLQGGEYRSLEQTPQPTVFFFPAWIEWIMSHNLGPGQFQTVNHSPFVEYQYQFVYPDPPFETSFTVPGWIPYLGGEEFAIEETQGELGATGQSNGSGSLNAQGGTALQLASYSLEGSVFGTGQVQFACNTGFDLQQGVVGLNVTVGKSAEAGIADLVPGLRSAESLAVVGRVVRWLNNTLKVSGQLAPGVNVETTFADNEQGELAFLDVKGQVSVLATAGIALSPLEDVEVKASGGGQPYIHLQVPANPGYLSDLGIVLSYGASYQVWSWEGEFEQAYDCKFPGVCEEPPPGAANGAWRVVSGAFPASPGLPRPSGDSDETILLADIYPRPQPALALDGGSNAALAFVSYDSADPAGKGGEISLLAYNGSAWSATPLALTADAQPDYAPAIVFGGGGKWPILWEHAEFTGTLPAEPTLAFAQSLEIAACDWNGAACSPIVSLTDDDRMDYAPQLSPAGANTALALWQTSDGTDILGAASHPLTLTYAVWTSAAGWGAPAPALAGLHDVLKVSFAARASNAAAVVFARDMDGDLNTLADSELFYSTFDGATWTAPARMTDDTIPDVQPSLAYDAAGLLHLAWLRGGDLVWLAGSWDEAQAALVRADPLDGGLLTAQLTRAANGNLALVWQVLTENGRNLGYAVYDGAAASWGAEQTLLDGDAGDAVDVETGHTLGFSGDGRLFAAYQKIAVETQDIPNVGPLPAFGQSDLAVLIHAVGRDLTFSAFTIQPENPAPGEAITLTAVLKNAGDLSIAAPQYRFYLEDQPLHAAQTAAALPGGQAVTVTLPTTALPGYGPYEFSVRADPDGLLAETDETNNLLAFTASLPDLRLDWLATAAGEGLTVTVHLSNHSLGEIDTPFQVALRAADPVTGTLLASRMVTATLAPSATLEITLFLSDPATLAGVSSLWAVADAGETIPESDETDNAHWIAPGVLPDLRLSVIGEAEGTMTVWLENIGLVNAANVQVEARLDGISGILVGDQTIPLLAAGEGMTLTYSLSGEHVLYVLADPQNAIAERSESNNLATQRVVYWRVFLPSVKR